MIHWSSSSSHPSLTDTRARINHDRPSDMETYVIKKWIIVPFIMNKILSQTYWCVSSFKTWHELIIAFIFWASSCKEPWRRVTGDERLAPSSCPPAQGLVKRMRDAGYALALLLIINDILRINNITVPIFVTLWMICYHGNGRVVLPFVINQIQITFITNTIYSPTS